MTTLIFSAVATAGKSLHRPLSMRSCHWTWGRWRASNRRGTALRLRAGALNLFDAEPPFAEAVWFCGYDPTQADLRQRFAYVKIAKKF